MLPSGHLTKVIENCPFTDYLPIDLVTFTSYVKLPEGKVPSYTLLRACSTGSSLSRRVMALSMPGPGPSDMMGLEFLIVRLWATTLFPGFHHCKNTLKLYQTLLINLDHLVGGFNPSEKYVSVGMRTFPIYGKTKNVPNHQPE